MKVIITGATGMVGKAVLIECLEDDSVSEVLLISRQHIDLKSPKIKELIIDNFESIPQHAKELASYDACFHCMGVSAVGLSEEKYTHLTFTLTKILADTLFAQNPNMIITYVSGAGTDTSESGPTMWARIKGKTENYLMQKRFKDAYAFRPGLIIPEKGVKSKTKIYNAIYILLKPFFPLLKKSKNVTMSSAVGRAMLKVCKEPESNKTIEIKDINRLAY